MPVAVAQGSVQMGTATWLSCWLCATDTNTTRTVPCRRHSFQHVRAQRQRDELLRFFSAPCVAMPRARVRCLLLLLVQPVQLAVRLRMGPPSDRARRRPLGTAARGGELDCSRQSTPSDMGPQGTPTARRLDKPAMRQPAMGKQLSQHQTPGCSKHQVTDVSPSDPAPPLCTWAQLIESILSSCSPSKLAMLQSTCRFFRQSAVIERIAKQSLKSVPRARSLKPSARCEQYTCTFPCPSPDTSVATCYAELQCCKLLIYGQVSPCPLFQAPAARLRMKSACTTPPASRPPACLPARLQ